MPCGSQEQKFACGARCRADDHPGPHLGSSRAKSDSSSWMYRSSRAALASGRAAGLHGAITGLRPMPSTWCGAGKFSLSQPWPFGGSQAPVMPKNLCSSDLAMAWADWKLSAMAMPWACCSRKILARPLGMMGAGAWAPSLERHALPARACRTQISHGSTPEARPERGPQALPHSRHDTRPFCPCPAPPACELTRTSRMGCDNSDHLGCRTRHFRSATCPNLCVPHPFPSWEPKPGLFTTS